MRWAKQSRIKLPMLSANAAVSPPMIITKAPSKNPFFLPARPMYIEMGIATIMPASICIDGGKVESDGEGANDRPAKAPSNISIGIGAPSTMLDATISKKLRVILPGTVVWRVVATRYRVFGVGSDKLHSKKDKRYSGYSINCCSLIQ